MEQQAQHKGESMGSTGDEFSSLREVAASTRSPLFPPEPARKRRAELERMEQQAQHRGEKVDSSGIELSRLRELAASMGCLCEHDLRTLTGWTEETTRQRRKRGDGPPYLLIGKNYFYPRAATLEHFQRRARGARGVQAVTLL